MKQQIKQQIKQTKIKVISKCNIHKAATCKSGKAIFKAKKVLNSHNHDMQKGEKSMHYFILCKKESRKVIITNRCPC